MRERWGFTKGWTRREDLDEPEIVHSDGKSFPQFCGFQDEKGETHLISRFMAISLGLIGLKQVPDWKTDWETYGKIMERRRKKPPTI